jgi:hypothetical protein
LVLISTIYFYLPVGAFRTASLFAINISLMAAFLGKERKIGFARAFFLSFFATPVIGFIVTLSSPRINDERYKQKMMEIAQGKAVVADVADQLQKLNELRKEGVLTDVEFQQQKEKLLNS